MINFVYNRLNLPFNFIIYKIQKLFQVTSTTGGQQAQSTTASSPRVYSRHSHSAQNPQAAPLVLSLQQIQGGGGLLILNSQPYHHQQSQQKGRKQHMQQVEVQQQVNEQSVIQSVNEEEEHHQQQQQTQQKIESQENSERVNVQSLQVSGNNSGMNDFSETLNLSQEDIQSTLFANLIPSSPSSSSAENMINTMDFIDSSDDVLVNLDAFDVFGDLPELHDLEAEQIKTETRNELENDNVNRSGNTVHIADYSPEWSYTEGGVKVFE